MSGVSFAAGRCLVLLTVVLAVAHDASATQVIVRRQPVLPARDLLGDRLWDDGKAEFSVYKGTIERYGKPRDVAAKIIVVKEDMDLVQRVKSEKGPIPKRTRTVIKQNYLHDFNTGTYDYHQMSSTFLDRETGNLQKLAMSSTEGCGMTYVEVLPRSDAWRHVSHSYWDGEGDRERLIPLRPRDYLKISGDALPLWLRRIDLTRPQLFEGFMLPSQVSGRVAETRFVPAFFQVIGKEDAHGLPVLVRLGGTQPGARVDRYWFDPEWPHVLTRFEGGKDATVLERVKTIRIAYWNETDPGDDRLLRP